MLLLMREQEDVELRLRPTPWRRRTSRPFGRQLDGRRIGANGRPVFGSPGASAFFWGPLVALSHCRISFQGETKPRHQLGGRAMQLTHTQEVPGLDILDSDCLFGRATLLRTSSVVLFVCLLCDPVSV